MVGWPYFWHSCPGLRRQILTSKVDPRAVRVNYCMLKLFAVGAQYVTSFRCWTGIFMTCKFMGQSPRTFLFMHKWAQTLTQWHTLNKWCWSCMLHEQALGARPKAALTSVVDGGPSSKLYLVHVSSFLVWHCENTAQLSHTWRTLRPPPFFSILDERAHYIGAAHYQKKCFFCSACALDCSRLTKKSS